MINRVRVTLAIVAACVAAPAIAAGAAGTVVFPDAGPESQLATILGEIEKNRIDAALQKTEALLLQYPNFRLGHLIKGDLLLARSKPLETFGNADNAPREKLSDLRKQRQLAIHRGQQLGRILGIDSVELGRLGRVRKAREFLPPGACAAELGLQCRSGNLAFDPLAFIDAAADRTA